MLLTTIWSLFPVRTKNNETSLINKEEEFEQGKHPNSLKALKKYHYPKGVSGNPLGRKPNLEAFGRQCKKLAEVETRDWNKKNLGSLKGQVIKRIWMDAEAGDMKKILLLAQLGCLNEGETNE